jgi:outer membrane autotransporter protein
MQAFKSKKFVRRFLLALACSTTPFVPADKARAQGVCTTDLNTATVTCTGGDIPGGFGTGIENGFTINVDTNTNVEGISVQDATINNGDRIAPGLGALAISGNNITLNNGAGTVSGDSGIVANSVNVTSNDGTIEGLGASGIAIQGGTVSVANGTGTISGVIAGISGAAVTVSSNNGTIEATNTDSVAIDAIRSADVTNGSGTIRANSSGGIAIGASDPNNPAIVGSVTVNNGTGTIQANGGSDASGKGGFAISAQNVTVSGNDGTIEALGSGGIAIAAGAGTATVANGSGTIRGSQFAVTSQNAIVTSNDGTITGDTAINAINGATVTNGTGNITGVTKAISAQNVTINGNNGTISAIGTALLANGGTATVTNGVGLITGGDRAIDGNSVNVTANAGTIKAVVTAGHAINATNDATVTNGSGTISADGPSGIAIAARSVNITANDGVIEATSGSAIGAANDATVINGIGRISGSATGIDGGTVTVFSNAGTIEATGTGGFAINALTDVTVTSNDSAIQATGPNGTAIRAGGLAKVTNDAGGIISGTAIGVTASTLDITNAAGATISGGTTGITGSGTVTNAGTISGGTNSVLFTGTGANTLTLQTGSALSGEATGSAAGTNNLILQGHGTASNVFSNFNHLDVNADTNWVWDNASPTIGTTAVNSGAFVLNSALQTTLTVKNTATLAGQGRVTGNITVMSGGTVAPGAAAQFSTLSSGGIAVFQPGSIYRVNVNAGGQNDKFAVGGATLNGNGTVNVFAQNGTYAPSTRYTILTSVNPGLGNGNVFNGVTTNLAFLTPLLSYDSNNVFLTLAASGGGGGGGGGGGTTGSGTSSGFGFATVAQTRNQKVVATSLDAGPVTSPLIVAVLNQTVSGARQAFDALSGEVFGSVHNVQTEQMHFTRDTMLGRMRQASYYGAPGELGALSFGGPELAYASGDAYAADFPAKAFPGKAAPRVNGPSRDLTFWAQGLGGWGHADSDGNAASLKSRFGGFLSGADARFGEAWRAGLVAGYMRTDLNVADRSSSAGIDSVQFGGYAGGKLGAFNVRGGASYSYDRIDTSRAIFFPGFTDKANAHFHGNVGQVFGEVGYGMALGSVAVEPLAGLAYVHVRDGSFAEAGGLSALSAASANESTGYSTLGVRAATAVPLANGTVLIPRGSVQWQHAFGDVTPVNALAFQSIGTSFIVAGIPIARNAALIEAGFDWRFSPQAKLGAFYQAELAAHAESHAFKGAFTWDF